MRVSRATSARASVVGPGIGSARSNRAGVLGLAEVLGAEQLGQAGDLRASLRGLAQSAHARREVVVARRSSIASGSSPR